MLSLTSACCLLPVAARGKRQREKQLKRELVQKRNKARERVKEELVQNLGLFGPEDLVSALQKLDGAAAARYYRGKRNLNQEDIVKSFVLPFLQPLEFYETAKKLWPHLELSGPELAALSMRP